MLQSCSWNDGGCCAVACERSAKRREADERASCDDEDRLCRSLSQSAGISAVHCNTSDSLGTAITLNRAEMKPLGEEAQLASARPFCSPSHLSLICHHTRIPTTADMSIQVQPTKQINPLLASKSPILRFRRPAAAPCSLTYNASSTEYLASLATNPILTKSCTSGSLS